MSTVASIAQFMAVLSGGVNPALLRQNPEMSGEAKANFQGLITSSGLVASTPMTADQVPLTAQSGVGAGAGDTPVAPICRATPSTPSPTGDQAPMLLDDATIICDGLNGPSSPQPSDGAGQNSTSTILQFVQQQASIDGTNAIVLNLSEKGISQDVIDELQKVFGANDLITVLRDPKLNTQLTNAIKDVGADHVESYQMVGIIDAILNQNKGDVETTLSFSADRNQVLDEALKKLLDDGRSDTDVPPVVLQPVQLVETSQPLQLAFFQQQITGGANDATQEISTLTGSQNPIPAKNIKDAALGDAKSSPAPDKNIQPTQPTATGAAGNGTQPVGADSVQSIADRLAGIIGHKGDQAGSRQSSDFSNLMLSADGQSLVNKDGNYILPFEAGFKTAAQAANPLTAQSSAAQSHPTTQMLALNLSRMATKAVGGEESQSYRLKLDPPEMGRVDIEMDIIKNSGHLKAVISAEKPETLGLLQRDMHVLLKAMQDAGFEGMTRQDLSFTLSQDQNNMFGGQGRDGKNNARIAGGSAIGDNDSVMVQTQMSIIIDPVTGQKSVNMLV